MGKFGLVDADRSPDLKRGVRDQAMPIFVLLAAVLELTPPLAFGQSTLAPEPIVVEDFEHYPSGVPPYEWKRVSGRRLVQVPRELDRDRDYFEIVKEDGRTFVRIFTSDESTQAVRPNKEGYRWNIRTHPRLRWDWRALRLPEGARETDRKRNDSGAALYVTFQRDWLGRPRSIKYVYSSTLAVGTIVDYGRLKVLVVASGTEGIGMWKTVERDVAADYRRIFGGDPPEEPLSITLWSDTDDTNSISEVNFDNLVLLP